MKTKNENVVNEEEIQKTVLDVLDEKPAVPDIKESETAGGLVISANDVKSAGGDRLAETNMIQKHVDNFLAKIAGETPVDDEVRDSTEYWLNEIANAGFSKMQDLSSDISFIDGISVTTKKVIQTGNLIVVDVNITNATGASIPANTKIADLSNTVCPRTIYFSYVYSGASLKVAYFQQSQLALKLIDELPDNRAIEFHIAYTI